MNSMESTYFWYKNHHICVECHSEEAAPSASRCPSCLAKCRERERVAAESRRKQEGYREWQKQYYHARRKRLKDNGLCTKCGKRKAREGRLTCAICANNAAREQRERLNQKPFWLRSALGICYKCDNPAVEGFKLCQEHLKLARKYMGIAVMARLAKKEGEP